LKASRKVKGKTRQKICRKKYVERDYIKMVLDYTVAFLVDKNGVSPSKLGEKFIPYNRSQLSIKFKNRNKTVFSYQSPPKFSPI
jgi:hypothetical protein